MHQRPKLKKKLPLTAAMAAIIALGLDLGGGMTYTSQGGTGPQRSERGHVTVGRRQRSLRSRARRRRASARAKRRRMRA